MFSTVTCLMLVASAGVTTDSASTAACSVSVVLNGSEFLNTDGVQPVLQATGIRAIYLPRRPEQEVGYSAERVLSETSDDQVVEVETRSLSYPSERVEPGARRISVQWHRVGVPDSKSGSSFVVRPGKYRLRLEYALSDPSRSRKKKEQVCVAYSLPFMLTSDSGYTTYK